MKIYILETSRKRMKQNIQKANDLQKTESREFTVVHERDGETVQFITGLKKTAYRTAKRLLKRGFVPVVWERVGNHKIKHELTIKNGFVGGKIHRAQYVINN